jgi:hypothetical protein
LSTGNSKSTGAKPWIEERVGAIKDGRQQRVLLLTQRNHTWIWERELEDSMIYILLLIVLIILGDI